MSQVSKHGEKRVRERVEVNKSSVDRQFYLALERGYRQHELTGRLKKWVVSRVFNSKYPQTCILYNDKCFIVSSEGTLVTVLNIPSNLLKDFAKLSKKRGK